MTQRINVSGTIDVEHTEEGKVRLSVKLRTDGHPKFSVTLNQQEAAALAEALAPASQPEEPQRCPACFFVPGAGPIGTIRHVPPHACGQTPALQPEEEPGREESVDDLEAECVKDRDLGAAIYRQAARAVRELIEAEIRDNPNPVKALYAAALEEAAKLADEALAECCAGRPELCYCCTNARRLADGIRSLAEAKRGSGER